MSKSNSDDVAQYYDANTRRFLANSDTGQAVAIHRKLWAPGIQTSEAAAAHVNDLILDATVRALGSAPATVTDLGCGVGGSLFHLASRWPETLLTGYTLSSTQRQMAQQLAQARGFHERCVVRQADFTQLEQPPRSALVMAIESHTHLPSLHDFFKAASRHIQPGGVLILVDDMLKQSVSTLRRQDQLRVDTFKRGWRLGHVPAVSDVLNLANQFGFDPVAQQDLGPYLRLHQRWDYGLNLIAPPLDWLGLTRVPKFANMVGGNALTLCYRSGVMRYMMMVWRASA
jgi:cyclopropane fatty-acyl-phospholipid synthase-like methyltransferase